MTTTITLPARFNGPARSANGGYAAGAIGELVKGPARVRLHEPPPLETPMRISDIDGRLVATIEGRTVLDAEPSDPPGPPPPFVQFDEAAAAMKRYAGYREHAAPTCFVCGIERPDGLHVHPGPTTESDLVASPWTPDSSLADHDDAVGTRIVWAALDCPGAWAAWSADTEGSYFPALGLMTLTLLEPIEVMTPHVVVAGYSATQGRRLFTSAAIYSAAGDLKAHADHVEVKVPYDWAR